MNIFPDSLTDKVGVRDELMLSDGRLLVGGLDKTKVVGVLEITNGITGRKMFRFNDIILPGSTYILEQMFKRRSSFGQTTLSQDLQIKHTIVPNQDNLKNETIFGIMIGNGGVETPDMIRAVKFKDKSVSGMIPIRVVDTTADLSTADQAKYAMKKQVGSKFYYYGKRFDVDPVVRHLFTDGTEVPPNIDTVDTTLGILAFAEVVFTISPQDVREWYVATYGNIANCRFNSITLVAGFLDGTDFAGVRAVTKLNIPNMFLRDAESFYTFSYKVYII